MFAPSMIQDLLLKNVIANPNKTALICEKQRLTYRQIDEMSSRLANAFAQNGIQAGDRVVFYLLNSVELVIGVFAALKANAIFSIIDYANNPDTLQKIARDCEAAALVTHDKQAALAASFLRKIPSLRLAILTGPNSDCSQTGFLSFDAIQREFSPVPPPRKSIDRDLAFLLYTSGSTGDSKGVMVTHRSALASVEGGVEYFGLLESDILASPLSLSFSPGINQLIQIFWVGGTLMLEPSFAFPTVSLKRMAMEGATGLACMPTIISAITHLDLSRYDLSRLRFMTSVGAALAPALVQKLSEKLPSVTLYSFYGMAEAAYSLGLEPAQLSLRPTSVGKPFPGTQAWVVDEEDLRLGPQQIGELVIRGSHVRSGYWNDPETSARRFRPGSLPGELVCYSGDLFRVDEEGYFFFVGRNDEVIKSGAKKIAPREIENALYGMSGILEVAAVGIPDPNLGQFIKAFVVLSPQGQEPLTVQDMLNHCYKTLEAYKVPREIEIRESLPKTSSGKIIKKDLQ